MNEIHEFWIDAVAREIRVSTGKGVVNIIWLLWTTLIFIGVGAFGTAFWIVAGSCAIAYLGTYPPRRRLKRSPEVFGAAFENVRFPSRDGVMLSGWLIPAREKPQGAIILCHGMSANRVEMLPWAESLWENDFTLLMFDFRRMGESGGDRCTAGFFEPQDLRGAVDYVKARADISSLPLGVFGFSMGGATAIMAAADDPRIQAVATHGAYATLTGAITQRCRHHFGPFAPLAERVLMAYGNRKRWFPASPAGVMPILAVQRLMPRPLLLLHGDRDPIIPAAHAHDLYAASCGSASLHVLHRSRHKRINRKVRPEAHEAVATFFCDHLG
jgi:fermentation-respiration switch protein FrsA (DUF1100 family)